MRLSVKILLLVLITTGIFLPIFECEFVICDDPQYVTQNARVLHGLQWPNVVWAFFTLEVANWHPLTWWSYQLDAQIQGINSRGFHLTNLILHLINTSILFGLLHRLSAERDRGNFVVALLFAIHPLHVESVAWVSERKDLLFTLFGLLALNSYVSYARGNRPAYAGALLFFGLSLMSKAMLVTFPFLLLVLDVWPLGRTAHDPSHLSQVWFRLVREKLPFFGLSLGAGVLALMSQKRGEALATLDTHPVSERLANAILAYGLYLHDTLLPINLSPNYYHPQSDMSFGKVAVAGLVLLSISAALIRFRHRFPAACMGWCWYLGTLVPVIGIVQIGLQQRADRYTYFPLIGIFWGSVWTLEQLASASVWRMRLANVVGLCVLGILGATTWHQIQFWQNSESLYQRAVDVEPNNPFAQMSLGVSQELKNEPEKAIGHYRRALEIDPQLDRAGALLARQVFLSAAGPDKREKQLRAVQSLERFPSKGADTQAYLGDMLRRLGLFEKAAENYAMAYKKDSQNPQLVWNLAFCLFHAGRLQEATIHFETALEMNPNNPVLLAEFARCRFASNQNAAAMQLLKRVQRMNFNDSSIREELVSVLFEMGRELVDQGRLVDAEQPLEAAVNLAPNNWFGHLLFGATLAGLQKPKRAEEQFLLVLQLNPQSANAHFSLGSLQAASGQRVAAIQHLRQALKLHPDYRPARDLLNSLETNDP